EKFRFWDRLFHLGLQDPDDVLTDRYDAPIAASVRDGEIIRAPVNALPAGQHFSIDDNQPFPIYGWLALYWQENKPTMAQPTSVPQTPSRAQPPPRPRPVARPPR